MGKNIGFRYHDIYIRRELQTNIVLPKSKAQLFTVKTYLDPITSLTIKELLILNKKFSSMDTKYHNFNQLGPVIISYIKYKQKENIRNYILLFLNFSFLIYIFLTFLT